MKRSIIIWILFLLFCYSLKAQEMIVRSPLLPEEYLYLAGHDLQMSSYGQVTRFTLAEESYIDLYYYPTGDSVLLIRTQCAPLCSSFVRVYDTSWKLIRNIPTPANMVLPEAYVQDGKLLWRENFLEDESPK